MRSRFPCSGPVHSPPHAQILNFHGVEAMVDALDTQFTAEYQQQVFANYTVNGQVTGLFKNAGTFSYIRIFGA